MNSQSVNRFLGFGDKAPRLNIEQDTRSIVDWRFNRKGCGNCFYSKTKPTHILNAQLAGNAAQCLVMFWLKP